MEEYRRIYRCAVMGQHPMRFPWGFDEEDDRCQKLKMELAQQIMVLHQCGVTQFLTACDCGVVCTQPRSSMVCGKPPTKT